MFLFGDVRAVASLPEFTNASAADSRDLRNDSSTCKN